MHTHMLVLLILFFTYCAVASILEPVIENVVHLQTSLPPPDQPGVWRKKMIWKSRWVQEWKYAKTYKPVWRKVWSPIEIREWLPIPKPPPVFHTPDSSGPPPDAIIPSSPDPSPPAYLPPSEPGPEPPFKPMPPAPQPTQRSTALHPVREESPNWPSPDQELLSNYHTIRDPQVENFNPPSTRYEVESSNPETLAQFLLPPKENLNSIYQSPSNSSSDLQEEPRKSPGSPYAAKLAQAVLREKFNKSLNPTERPSGLTDVIFRPNFSTTTASPSTRVAKSAIVSSTTESSTGNIFIVTPVSLLS